MRREQARVIRAIRFPCGSTGRAGAGGWRFRTFSL
jgi:hypothetical protein